MRLFRRKNKVSKSFLYSTFIGNSPVVLYNYNAEDYISKGYTSNGEIYSITKKITDKCAASTPYVYIDSKGVKSKSRKDSDISVAKHRLYVHKELKYAPEDNDLVKLLKNPNTLQTWREFITLARIFYFVQGETFIYREAGDDDCALSLHVVPAHLMTQVVSSEGLVAWKLNLFNGLTREIPASDVFHLKMPNPVFDASGTQLRGMSPLLAGLKYLQLDDSAIQSWIKSVENEGAKGLISPNHADPNLWLTPDQVETTQATVETKIHGADNKNKIVVSGMPLQYTHIGLSPDALNIVKGLEHAGVKLCDLWNVPAVLFDPNPTYQNAREGRLRLVMDVVLPYLSLEEDKLNKWLVEPFSNRDNKTYIIDYDLSSYEELRISDTQVEAFLKTHSINEVRVMQGSDESEEPYANDIFIAQGLVPLSDYNV